MEAKRQYSFGETIQNISRSWNRCKSYCEEETVISLEYYRINGVAQRWLQVYATVATGVLHVQVRVQAYYDCGYRLMRGHRR